MRPRSRLLLLAASTALLAGAWPATGTWAAPSGTPRVPAAATIGTWTRMPDMAAARHGPTATVLTDGRVLVAGGTTPSGTFLASAEIFDPSTRRWTAPSNMTEARAFATASLLADGRVLVAGGLANGSDSLTAEIYDPARGAWTATASMHQTRDAASAVVLPDGDVLVVGGWPTAGTPYGSTEVERYSTATATWKAVAPMKQGAADRTVGLLPDGRVLVAGGIGCCGYFSLADTEVYDPTLDEWATEPAMSRARWLGDAEFGTFLPDGRLLMPGGNTRGIDGSSTTNTVETFAPGTMSWSTSASMHVARSSQANALAGDSLVLAAGGYGPPSGPQSSAEVYNPASNTWTYTPPMPVTVGAGQAVRLHDGSVLLVGGSVSDTSAATAQLFTLTSASLPGAPTGVTAATSGRSASVSFAPPASDGGSPITGYQALCTSNTGGATRRGTSATSPITVPALTAGATYTCTVTATNVAGAGPPSAASAPFTVPTLPGAPSHVTIRVVDAGTALQVAFTAPASDGGSPITGYQAICTSSTGGTLRDGWGTGTPIRVSQVTGLSQYRCKVLAVNLVGAGTASAASARVITPPGLPGAPTAVTVTAGSTLTSAFVGFTPPAWDGGHPITGYLAACTSSTGGTARSTVGTAPPVQLSGLTPGASYTCIVAAINSAGTGPTSAPSAPYTVPS